MYHDLLGETAPREYARSMARALLREIEAEFTVKIPRKKVSNKISYKKWKRFTNVFFKGGGNGA